MVITLSFDGCGWNFPFMAGVVKSIQKVPKQNFSVKYVGVSSGACVALAASLDIDMDVLLEESLKYSFHCRMFPFMSVSSVKSITRKLIVDKEVPRQNFAMAVSEVRGKRIKSVVFDKFQSKSDLIDKLEYTCSIPLVTTYKLFNEYYDGVFACKFVNPPWESDRIIKVSSWYDNEEANYKLSTPLNLMSAIVPLEDEDLRLMYLQGQKVGEQFIIGTL